jgi:hypothetical protein
VYEAGVIHKSTKDSVREKQREGGHVRARAGNTLHFSASSSNLSLTSHTLAVLYYKQTPSEAGSASKRLKFLLSYY